MEQMTYPSSDQITITPKSESNSPPPSDHNPQFASDFTTLYHSIFPPKTSNSLSLFSLTPSTSPSSSATSAAATDEHFENDVITDHRLHQASLILEFQQLSDHYDLCLSRLQSLTKEMERLRQENNDLRLVNNELIKVLSHAAAIQNVRQPDVIEPRNVERVTLLKSISVRSNGYLKMMNRHLSTASSSSATLSRGLVSRDKLDQLVSGSRVCIPSPAGGGNSTNNKRSDDIGASSVEMEVYNQGMWKTELCNKWQETGTCPYGDYCQFAHGIKELRPIIRHPRYKTHVCRMVIAGEVCPYGHRCHFRHSLSDQDRLLLGPR